MPGSPASEPARIRAHELGFTYAGRPAPALADVSFDVEPGELLLVLGPSGSGKSTLALMLAGLIPRDLPGEMAGRLEIDRREVRSVAGPALAERVGLVLQDPASQVVMDRVEDDVAFGLENRGWPRPAMRDRVGSSLRAVDLDGLERRRTVDLSGGQQQRLALAGALAPGPGVLVLDEPTANLDPPTAVAFLDRLASMRRARSATIVLVEHRVEAAWPAADRILALGADGRPIAFGSPGEVVKRHGEAMWRAGIWLPRTVSSALAVGSDEAQPWAVATDRDPATERSDGSTSIATARDVSFAFQPGRPVVQGVDLGVSPKERIALVGRNGSGKSTLGRLLVGLLEPGTGRVHLDGRVAHRLAAADLARIAGYVFQDPEQQFLARTVEDEVRLGLRPAEVARLDGLMVALGLPLGRFGGRSPYRLSGGEKRRLSLACVLVRRPRLLVLDEPTFGQDRLGFEAIVAIVRDHVDGGAAVVAATHDLRFATAVAGRAVLLEAGRVAGDGPVGDVLAGLGWAA